VSTTSEAPEGTAEAAAERQKKNGRAPEGDAAVIIREVSYSTGLWSTSCTSLTPAVVPDDFFDPPRPRI
jgi:hypothetical protein